MGGTIIDVTADVLVQTQGGSRVIITRDTTVGELLAWASTEPGEGGAVTIMGTSILPRKDMKTVWETEDGDAE